MSEIISTSKTKMEYWREVLARQAEGNKAIREFCMEHQISLKVFYYWRKKFSKPDRKTGRQNRFIAIARNDCKANSPRIALPNGVTIELGAGLDSPSTNRFLLQLCGVGLQKEDHSAKS